jgi:hypothetical protein
MKIQIKVNPFDTATLRAKIARAVGAKQRGESMLKTASTP